MSSYKVEDYKQLVDLFLDPKFEPLSETATPIPESEFIQDSYECDLDDDQDFDDDHGESDSHHHHIEVTHNKPFYEKVGRKLAECGDEIFQKYQSSSEASAAEQAPWISISQPLQEVFSKVADSEKSKDPAVQEAEKEEAWKTFKGIMNSSIAGTGVEDGYRTLGAFLLTLCGLKKLQESVKDVARTFSLRYIQESGMAEAVNSAGGLEGLVVRRD